MTSAELPVDECDHMGPGWCVACRPPRDDDEPPLPGVGGFHTHMKWWDLETL
jgi:hypothetical protein